MTDEVQQDFDFLSFFSSNSDYFTILLIVLFFVLVVIIVLRVNEDTIFTGSQAITRFEIKMEQQTCSLKNPYCVCISTDHEFLELSLENASKMYIMWGVLITEFFVELRQPWLDIVDALHAGNWMNDSTLFAEDILEFRSGKHRHKLVQPEEANGEKLGPRPRTRYPVIVITVLNDTEIDMDSFPQIVAMFSVIHVQDSICTGETQVLYQYLKTSDNQVISLQPLFVPQIDDGASQQNMYSQSNTNNGDQTQKAESVIYRDNSGDSDTCTNTLTHRNTEQTPGHLSNENCNEESVSECVVCQNCDVMIAILPCRHTCICDSCLEQLDKCPMCRGYIISYFRIGHNTFSNSIHPENGNHDRSTMNNIHRSRQPGEGRWAYYNRRLNQFLGFE